MIKMDCGCQFETDENGKIILDYDNIRIDCPRVYDMLCNGFTCGVFQIESQLGKMWCKRVKPTNIEQISDVISIIRPGTLKSYEDGKSLTQHYVDRKHGKEEVKSCHPALDKILQKTYGVLTYQEQSMQIAKELAGFNLQEADELRKGIGKKDSQLIASLKGKFLEGCKRVGILNKEQANEVFSWIQNSQRYAFNLTITEDAIVTLKNKTKKTLKDVCIGEKIKCPNNIFSTVTNKYDHGIQDVYEITLESGKKIKCSIEHKFLCEDNKQRSLKEILESGLSIFCEDGVN